MGDMTFSVVSANTDRLYTKVYQDFLDTELLTADEKMIFILLKRHIDFREDNGSFTDSMVYPSIETLCKRTGWSNKKVINTIKKLINKGIVKKVRRGLTKHNLYILSDKADMWCADSPEQLKERAEETELEKALRIVKESGMYEVKEKEPVSPTDQSIDADPKHIANIQISDNDYTVSEVESQGNTYTSIDDVKKYYGYDDIINSFPNYRDILNCIMEVIFNTINSNRKKYTIKGSDISANVVKSQLMKLNQDDLIYAADQYRNVTGRIKNPDSYILSILYGAKKDGELDIINQVQHDLYGE